MANEEDECDSAGLFPVASQTDVNQFLQTQAKRQHIRSFSSSDDDETSSIDDSFVQKLTKKSSYLSQSCFASISSQKQPISDDLTELKWLNTFKFKEFQSNQEKKPSDEDPISKLSNDLKSLNPKETSNAPFGVLIFLALYSQREDKDSPWEFTVKQIYEHLQSNAKAMTSQRGWKNSLKQTLLTTPCFVKTKRDLPKSRSMWTIDPYYRPLLTKAYLTSLNRNEEKQTESAVDNFAPKATVKAKVLPRLYERLCEEKASEDIGDEADSSSILKRSHRTNKRARSASLSNEHVSKPANPPTSSATKSSRRPPSSSSMNVKEDATRKSIITTRSQSAARAFAHRRKSSPPKKRATLGLTSHRPNTRINRKNIEQDLELLRQAQPLDLSKATSEDVLDLSVSR